MNFLRAMKNSSVGLSMSLFVSMLFGSMPLSLALAQQPTYQLWSQAGQQPGDYLGSYLSPLGDLNHDGFDDFIVSLHTNDRVQIRSGVDGSILGQVTGPATSNFGRSVAGLGDLDGDGYPDFAVGASHEQVTTNILGAVHVYSGRTLNQLYSLTASGMDNFGGSAANLGDITGDGYDDLVVGAPQQSAVPGGTGYAKVFSGRNGSLIYTFLGAASNNLFGQSTLGIGDANGDGVPDIAVSAVGSNANRVYLYSGRTGTLVWTVQGPGGAFGTALSKVGDVNSDGRPDLVVGATAGGYVRVLSGSNGALIHHVPAPFSGFQYFGETVAGGADFNFDGLPDFVVGAATGLQQAGYVDIYSGSNAQLISRINGQTANGNFGNAVTIVDKLDGDQFPDIVIASRQAFSGVGAVYGYTVVPPATVTALGPARIGTTVSYQLASPGDANMIYVAPFSGGTSPGLTLTGNRILPLNPDGLFQASLFLPNPVVRNTVGTLDGSGAATVQLIIPNNPQLIGLQLYIAFVTVDLNSPILYRRISQALPILIQ